MKRTIACAALLVAAPAFAQMAEIDADGDGAITYEEMAAVAPGTTQEAFAALDTDVDGAVDEAELAAAVEAGLVRRSEG